MTRDELLQFLRNEAQRISRLAPDTVWYLFGSALRGFECAADIDILILCDTDETVALARHELRNACISLPLHLFLLTRDEEAELGFIVTAGGVQVYPV
jgi:predicted nucleotidyltransferase